MTSRANRDQRRVDQIDRQLRQERVTRQNHAATGNRQAVRRSAERTNNLSDERGRILNRMGRKGLKD